MSKNRIIGSTGLLFVIVISMAVVGVDLAAALAQQETNAGTMVQAPKPAASPVARKGRRGCDPDQQEQTDLSGTYTANVDYPEGGLSGDATLTITGNQFTLASGSTNQAGRISAVTTCGYTGATLVFGEVAMPKPGEPAPQPPPMISVRVKKIRDRLTLTSVEGEKRSFAFGAGATASRKRRAKPAASAETATEAAAPTPAEVAQPAEAAVPATPAKSSRGRRKRVDGSTNPNTNAEPATPATPAPTPSVPSAPVVIPDSAGPVPPESPEPGAKPKTRHRRGSKKSPKSRANTNSNTNP